MERKMKKEMLQESFNEAAQIGFNESIKQIMDKYAVSELKAKRIMKHRLIQGDISEI